MRKMLVLLFIVCMLPLSGLAQGAKGTDSLFADALYPARDASGKWGYINYGGEWTLTPQWDYAHAFRGRYAVVGMGRMGTDGNPEGLIDKTGAYILPLSSSYLIGSGYDGYYYGGKDTGIYYVSYLASDGQEEKAGFVDIPSGYVSGPRWGDVWHWVNDSGLIAVRNHTDYSWGYADRATGSMVVPYIDGSVDPHQFYDGWQLVEHYTDEGDFIGSEYMDIQGRKLPLPDGIIPYDSFAGGLAAVGDLKTGLLGFIDTAGSLAIAPAYEFTYGFVNNHAVVEWTDGGRALIDRAGKPVGRAWQDAYDFSYGFARVEENDKSGFINEAGETVIEPVWDFATYFMSNGLCWVDDAAMGSSYLIDSKGSLVSDPIDILECMYVPRDGEYYDFSEGLKAVSRNGLYGFMNEKGAIVIPCTWSYAEDFVNGLAYVKKDGKMGYINHDGKIVYME